MSRSSVPTMKDDWMMSPTRKKIYLMIFLLVFVGCTIPTIQGQRAAASLGTKVKKFRDNRSSNKRGNNDKTKTSDEYYVQGENKNNNATIVATMNAILVRPLKELFLHIQSSSSSSSSSSTEGDTNERQNSNPPTEAGAIVVALLVGLFTILYSFWKYYVSKNRKEDGES